MKLQIITLGLISIFFYSCSGKTDFNKKEEIETITEQKSNISEIVTEEKLELITEQKSNVSEIVTGEKLETITEQKNNVSQIVMEEKLETITEQENNVSEIVTGEKLETITEQKNNVSQIVMEEKLELITEQKSNVSEIVTGEKLETITEQKITIPELLTEKLMNNFKTLNIETLKGCGNLFSQEYDCVGALDGDGTNIIILRDKINRKLNFEAIYPGGKENKDFPEKQITAQKILNLIHEKIDLKELLHQYMKHLPSGTYGYYGVNMIELK